MLFVKQARAEMLVKTILKPFMNGAFIGVSREEVFEGTKKIANSKHKVVAGNKNKRSELRQLETLPLLERKPVMGLAIIIAMKAVEALQLILVAFLLRG